MPLSRATQQISGRRKTSTQGSRPSARFLSRVAEALEKASDTAVPGRLGRWRRRLYWEELAAALRRKGVFRGGPPAVSATAARWRQFLADLTLWPRLERARVDSGSPPLIYIFSHFLCESEMKCNTDTYTIC